jgi:hypothetical protein
MLAIILNVSRKTSFLVNFVTMAGCKLFDDMTVWDAVWHDKP